MEECCRKKHREEQEYKDLINRLNRIEGQIRGIRTMVEEERYCVDILTQASAVSAALNGFQRKLLEDHVKTCVAEDIKAGKDGAPEDLCDLIRKLMK